MPRLFDLCEQDEQAAVAFLARAVPALNDAGIQPASLDILPALTYNPDAYGLGGNAVLAALAAEWVGPYAAQANTYTADLPAPTTVRELVLAFLLGDDTADGKTYDIGFRFWASNDTEHWNLKGTPLEGVPVFGLYLICEGERTHLCSFAPSSRADFVENVFCYPSYGQTAVEAYMDGKGGELARQNDQPIDYVSFKGDRAALDKREVEKGDVTARHAFGDNPVDLSLGAVIDIMGDITAESDPHTVARAFYRAAAEAAWEEANEWASGNPDHPRVICAA